MSTKEVTAKSLSKEQVERGFGLVRTARAVLAALPERELSERTTAKYEALFAGMVKDGRRPEDAAQTRRSYYVYRAAFNFMIPRLVRNQLKAADQAFKSKQGDTWWQHILELRRLLGQLQRYLPDPEREQAKQGPKSAITIPRGASRSKRASLKDLPDTWRETLWQVIPDSSTYRAAIAVSMLTGARPAELVSGVKVENGKDGSLVVTIRGAKTQGGKYGQAARQLTISSTTPMARYLRQLAGTKAVAHIKIADARLFGNQVTAYSRKCWPKRKSHISPYSFRHQFAADLKAAGDPDAVSLALGHSVADTAQHYGTARQARNGGARLLAVSTSRELKKDRKLSKSAQIARLQRRDIDRIKEPSRAKR